MKKEILIAIMLGLLVGLIITIGMYRARTAVQNPIPQAAFEPVPTSLPDSQNPIQAPSDGSLDVLEPEDEMLTKDENLRVTGHTFPQIPVVILQNAKEVILISDDQGNFSTTITLESGSNILHIRALPQGDNPVEVIRTVVYSTADLFGAQKTSTQSATSVQ